MHELRVRVTLAGAFMTAVLAGVAFGLAGPGAGLGVVAAGGMTLANFWWLVSNAVSVFGTGAAPRRAVWVVAAGFRFIVVAAALVALLASGLVHPVAFVAGLAILPAAVILLGLRAAARSEAC
jgi:ATP synthase I chain